MTLPTKTIPWTMEGSKKLIAFSLIYHNIWYFLFFVSKLLANFGSNLDPWKGDINSGRDWVPGVGETAILIIFWRFVRNGKNFWGQRRWMDAWVTIKYFSQSLASLMTRCCLNITLHDFSLFKWDTPRLASLVGQKFQRFKKLKELRKYASSIALGEFFTPGSSWFFGNKFLHLNFVFRNNVSDNQNIACLAF